MSDMKPPMTLRLTPQQTVALTRFELRIEELKHEVAVMRNALQNEPLANALESAANGLWAAHGAYIAETQRTVSIAAPEDIKRVLVGG